MDLHNSAGRAQQRNAEATGSNPVEAPKTFFGAFLQLFKLRLTEMVTYSFHLCYVWVPYGPPITR